MMKENRLLYYQTCVSLFYRCFSNSRWAGKNEVGNFTIDRKMLKTLDDLLISNNVIKELGAIFFKPKRDYAEKAI